MEKIATGNKKTIDSLPDNSTWTSAQAYILAVFCLVLGVALGYLFRGSASPAALRPLHQLQATAVRLKSSPAQLDSRTTEGNDRPGGRTVACDPEDKPG